MTAVDMVLIAGMAMDTWKKIKSHNQSRIIWVISKSCDHYTTMELAAGKQLFKSKLHSLRYH